MDDKFSKKKDAVAVALSYRSGMTAPVVAAKGEKELVSQMRKIARRYGIAQVKSPELARKLSTLEEQQEVPISLYRDVAEVFAKKVFIGNRSRD